MNTELEEEPPHPPAVGGGSRGLMLRIEKNFSSFL